MYFLGDLADWWDIQRAQARGIVESHAMAFVDRHPNAFGIAVAGTEQTLLDFTTTMGAGFVDTLRIGRGVRTGTVKGIAEDGLRVLSVTPFGKIARWAQTGRGLSAMRVANLVTDPLRNFGICTSVAATQALRMVNVPHFISVANLLKVAGIDLTVGAGMVEGQVGGALIKDVLPALRQFGAKITRVNPVKTMAALEASLRQITNSRGVMLFSVKWKMFNSVTRTMDEVGHTMVAFIDHAGAFRIADRTGAIVAELKDLPYYDIGSALPSYGSMAFIDNAAIARLEGLVEQGILNILALEAQAVPLITRDQSHSAVVH